MESRELHALLSPTLSNAIFSCASDVPELAKLTQEVRRQQRRGETTAWTQEEFANAVIDGIIFSESEDLEEAFLSYTTEAKRISDGQDDPIPPEVTLELTEKVLAPLASFINAEYEEAADTLRRRAHSRTRRDITLQRSLREYWGLLALFGYLLLTVALTQLCPFVPVLGKVLVFGTAFFGIALFVSGWVLQVVAAFRRSALWGIAHLIPLGSIFFLTRCWDSARRPFFVRVAGLALFLFVAFALGPLCEPYLAMI